MSPRVSPKDYAQLIGRAADDGCDVTYTRGGHVRIDTPSGPVFAASTASDRRGVLNVRAQLRQRGVAL